MHRKYSSNSKGVRYGKDLALALQQNITVSINNNIFRSILIDYSIRINYTRVFIANYMHLYFCYMTQKIVKEFKEKHKGHEEIQQAIPEKVHILVKNFALLEKLSWRL
jgi:predicted nucleic acid-binding protein